MGKVCNVTSAIVESFLFAPMRAMRYNVLTISPLSLCVCNTSARCLSFSAFTIPTANIFGSMFSRIVPELLPYRSRDDTRDILSDFYRDRETRKLQNVSSLPQRHITKNVIKLLFRHFLFSFCRSISLSFTPYSVRQYFHLSHATFFVFQIVCKENCKCYILFIKNLLFATRVTFN